MGGGDGSCLLRMWSFNPLAFCIVPILSAVSGILYFWDSVLLAAENKGPDFCCGGGTAVTQHGGVGKGILASNQNSSSFLQISLYFSLFLPSSHFRITWCCQFLSLLKIQSVKWVSSWFSPLSAWDCFLGSTRSFYYLLICFPASRILLPLLFSIVNFSLRAAYSLSLCRCFSSQVFPAFLITVFTKYLHLFCRSYC